jgi:hypothetical protein
LKSRLLYSRGIYLLKLDYHCHAYQTVNPLNTKLTMIRKLS